MTEFLIVGDSKSTSANSWPTTLVNSLNALTPTTIRWLKNNQAVEAQGAAYFAAHINDILQAATEENRITLYNIGVNDFGLVTKTDWINNVETVTTAIRARWSDAIVYLMRPWKRGFDGTADTFAGWIDEIVASNPSYIKLGPDERVWLKGSDDGATMTTDGIHYSAAGEAECAVQWKTVLGF